MLLIKNGRVLNPATKTDAAMEVLLDGDRIKEVGAPGKTSGSATWPASTITTRGGSPLRGPAWTA